MVSFTISISSSEGLRTSFHPTTATPPESVLSSPPYSLSQSRSNSHSFSNSDRSASSPPPPPANIPPPPYYQKYQHPRQQLLYRAQNQSHRHYSHPRYALASGASSSTRNQNGSVEGIQRLLPSPSRASSTSRGRGRANNSFRAQQLTSHAHNNDSNSNNNNNSSDSNHRERRMSYGRGGAGNIRRPSVVPFATPNTQDNPNGTSGRRRSSVWSAINSFAPGSSPDRRRGSVGGGEGGGGGSGGSGDASGTSGNSIMSFFTRRKSKSPAVSPGD